MWPLTLLPPGPHFSHPVKHKAVPPATTGHVLLRPGSDRGDGLSNTRAYACNTPGWPPSLQGASKDPGRTGGWGAPSKGPWPAGSGPGASPGLLLTRTPSMVQASHGSPGLSFPVSENEVGPNTCKRPCSPHSFRGLLFVWEATGAPDGEQGSVHPGLYVITHTSTEHESCRTTRHRGASSHPENEQTPSPTRRSSRRPVSCSPPL